MRKVVGCAIELNEAVVRAGVKGTIVLGEDARTIDPIELLAGRATGVSGGIVPPHAEPKIVPVG